MSVRRLNAEKVAPMATVAFFAILFMASFFPPKPKTPFDVQQFSKLPVLQGGRLKPLDTVARTSLLMMRGHQTVRVDGRTISASQWLLDMFFRPAEADRLAVFEIDDPDVLGLMGMEQTKNRYYSFEQLHSHLTLIEEQANQIQSTKADQRSRYQRAVINLSSRITLYQKLENSLQIAGMGGDMLHELASIHARKAPAALQDHYKFLTQAAEFYPLPEVGQHGDPTYWKSVGASLNESLASGALHPGTIAYSVLGEMYRTGDAGRFNEALHDYGAWLKKEAPNAVRRAQIEFLFNVSAPFYQSLMMYVVAFLLVFVSWLVWPRTLNRSAFFLLVFAFGVHTLGLGTRMWLQGRPPVTNLYSSAIFVGWMAVLLGLILERLFRNGIGSLVAGAIGFITLIIAHHLASSGDTLEMMRAVLDSNFWLATHVVCITVGYSSTFLSGFLAIVAIFRRRFDSAWNEPLATSLDRMVYGIVCFALFFSFLGTILGGIWADQSWGRFWGWDPKENGALMIVLWNALCLHVRSAKMVTRADFMVLAVFGNIVTAFSWFGVNMLGIGLHSYGFMDKAFSWLVGFAVIQMVIMILGSLSPEPPASRR